MGNSLLDKDNVATDYIDPNWDRWVVYQTNGTLKISDLSVLKSGEGWEDPRKVVLKNWEEICRLKDFLNDTEPVNLPKPAKEEMQFERASA
ncbi:hypothetical protein [uncultured Brevibacillus sp.]|uniref:hypothetical protein n=1 Tax=uncultured Brevibacillus sp. TaxID=169970 RepID=UPI0025975CD7|nr:hypothetical protein [uncultured Brevibacillus sp.]